MKTIGKYRIRGLLGRGGMGRVYRIEIPVIRKIAALKYLAPNPFLISLLGMRKIEAMFTAEAVAMAALKHPAIAEIRDFDYAGNRPYYLIDLYSHNLGAMIGETYQMEKPSRILPVEKAVIYTRQILEGLECMHDAGVIHRDIKPFNVLLTDRDTVKICDFGLSKLRGEKMPPTPGLKVGTPGYAAPEQEIEPDSADERSDLYAVGVLLYRMLTGRLPDDGKHIGMLNPELNNDWNTFFRKALEPSPCNRFQTADEMGKALSMLMAARVRTKEKICEMTAETSDPPFSRDQQMTASLRKKPRKIAARHAIKDFELDPLWRPKTYIHNHFDRYAPGIVKDLATGRVWQQSGTAYPVTWQGAAAHIERLNHEGYGGFRNWRLPTIPELLSLLTPPPYLEDFCLAPIFDPRQKWLWSCDRKSFTAAWYVGFAPGYVSANDFSAYCHAKGVCDPDSAAGRYRP